MIPSQQNAQVTWVMSLAQQVCTPLPSSPGRHTPGALELQLWTDQATGQQQSTQRAHPRGSARFALTPSGSAHGSPGRKESAVCTGSRMVLAFWNARVQPQQVSGSPKDGRRRRRMRGQTPSLMPENGQPLWV